MSPRSVCRRQCGFLAFNSIILFIFVSDTKIAARTWETIIVSCTIPTTTLRTQDVSISSLYRFRQRTKTWKWQSDNLSPASPNNGPSWRDNQRDLNLHAWWGEMERKQVERIEWKQTLSVNLCIKDSMAHVEKKFLRFGDKHNSIMEWSSDLFEPGSSRKTKFFIEWKLTISWFRSIVTQ